MIVFRLLVYRGSSEWVEATLAKGGVPANGHSPCGGRDHSIQSWTGLRNVLWAILRGGRRRW